MKASTGFAASTAARKLPRSSCSGPASFSAISPTQRGRRYLAVAPLGGELRHEAREFHQVLAGLARRVAAEAGEAVGDVGRIADLVGLAVAHDVDAGRDLPAHDLGDRIGDDGRGGRPVADLAFLPREQHVGHRLRARQAADVRGEDAPGAGPHR